MEKQNSGIKENSSFFLLPEIDNYKGTHQPILTAKKKEAIEEKLMLEKQANKKAKQREKKAEPYIPYDYNPFMVYKQKDINALLKAEQQLKKNQYPVHIVDKMAEIRQKRADNTIKEESKELANEFLWFRNETVQFSEKMLYKVGEQNSKANLKNYEADQLNIPEKQDKSKKFLQFDDFSAQSIDFIAAEKEQNFFLRDNNFNVFTITRDNVQQSSPIEKLKQYYFSFNSMCEKISKVKIPVYRDLSRMGRSAMKGVSTAPDTIIDHIDSIELSFKLEYLIFQDIMSAASNRFSTDFVSKMLNEDFSMKNTNKDDKSETSSEEDQSRNLNILKENERQKKMNFIDENEEVQEIEDYKKLHYQPDEEYYWRKCEKKEKRIMDDLNLQQHLYKNTISDKILHYDIKGNVKKGIQTFTSMGSPKMDIDRVVRANKLNKNKNQAIKIQTLIHTLAQKNNHDEKINKSKKIQ